MRKFSYIRFTISWTSSDDKGFVYQVFIFFRQRSVFSLWNWLKYVITLIHSDFVSRFSCYSAKLRIIFKTTKKVEKKCCATFATFATFSVWGASLIVTSLWCHVSLSPPCKGCRVSRRCLEQYPKLGRVHSQTSALIWCSGIRKRLRKLRKLRMQKRLTWLTRLTWCFWLTRLTRLTSSFLKCHKFAVVTL